MLKQVLHKRYKYEVASCLAMLVLGFSASGCSTLQGQLDKQTQAVTGAAPLISNPLPVTKAQLLASIAESYQKCGAYKRTLLFGSRAGNFGFDVLTTTFSALATAFKPVATIHALTAAATITSGSKTALDADVYMNATAPLMAQALTGAYDDKMQTLHDRVAADTNAALPAEDFSQIVSIHEACSLSEALVVLQSLQAKPVTPAPGISEEAVLPGAVFALANGSQVVITAKTGTAPNTMTAFTMQDASGGNPVSYGPLATPLLLTLLNSSAAKSKSAPST